MVVTGAEWGCGAALVGCGLLCGVCCCQKKTLPRGNAKFDTKKQSKFVEGSSSWANQKDENGTMVNTYHGEKALLNYQMPNCTTDKNGLMLTAPGISTYYEAVFKSTDFCDADDALGKCVKHHTFKDAFLPDGKPNPKPAEIDTEAVWTFQSYRTMKETARAFGAGLRGGFNIGQKEKIAIWSKNCPEWLLVDFSCAAFNWISVSVYDTLGPDAASYICADSGAKVVVCEDATFPKVPAMLTDDVYSQNPGKDVSVVVYIGNGDEVTKKKLLELGVKVLSFEEVVSMGKATAVVETPPKPEDICTLMYTSGTTGAPKGVILSHRNAMSVIGILNRNPSLEITRDMVHLSYLPLAHIFERIICMGVLGQGGKVCFSSKGAKALLADLKVVRPTLFAGVPKVYENVRDGVMRKMTGVKKTMLEKAMKAKIADIETGCGYHPIWDKLIFSKTKEALGGRVRFCISGGAPISKETLHFVLCALGPVVQGYGATETAAASTLTMGFDLSLGHVGPPVGACMVRLVDVPDMNYYSGDKQVYDVANNTKALECFSSGRRKSGGEVWVGGPSVSCGYFDPAVHSLKSGLPSNGMSPKTADDFFEEDGMMWFKTGDIGSWTENGTLKIVDRKKNMFKTSLGEYVPVEEIEKAYQDNCPFADFVFLPKETKVSYVALCVVVSDSIGQVKKWAAENKVQGDNEKICNSEAFKKYLLGSFSAIAKEKKLAPFMHIKKTNNLHVEYLPLTYQEDWVAGVMCANGHKEQLLTATFKARRAQLDQYFAPAFPVMYDDRPSDHILP